MRRLFSRLLHFLQRRRLARRQRQLEELQIVEQQRQWLRSFERTADDADLAAGYDQPHFNVME